MNSVILIKKSEFYLFLYLFISELANIFGFGLLRCRQPNKSCAWIEQYSIFPSSSLILRFYKAALCKKLRRSFQTDAIYATIDTVSLNPLSAGRSFQTLEEFLTTYKDYGLNPLSAGRSFQTCNVACCYSLYLS